MRLNKFLNEENEVREAGTVNILLGPRCSGKSTEAYKKVRELTEKNIPFVALEYNNYGDNRNQNAPLHDFFSTRYNWEDIIDKKYFFITDVISLEKSTLKEIENIDFKFNDIILDDWYYFPRLIRQFIWKKCIENNSTVWIYSGSPFKFSYDILKYVRFIKANPNVHVGIIERDWLRYKPEYQSIINDFIQDASLTIRKRTVPLKNAKDLRNILGNTKYDLDVKGDFFDRQPTYEYPNNDMFTSPSFLDFDDILIENISYDKKFLNII